uniref:Uncharacterized protein n=1 Tax=Alexandrium monilatum TaxID=311494 RepID=A0A7S4RVM9_9DINO|mmetsp:Transcript_81694/g.243579  ORF Transcript_81694/g.243579 Transcript_81694/m.243579 type:complete len:322 (+) Transcript_81694:77-1042(+)
MVNSPAASWAPPPSPLPSPLGSPLPEASLEVAPRRLTFRERLAELAAEYEELQVRCDSLLADNRELRSQLAASHPDMDLSLMNHPGGPSSAPAAWSGQKGGGIGDPREGREGDKGREGPDGLGSRRSEGPDRAEGSYHMVDHRMDRMLAKRSDGDVGPGPHQRQARGSMPMPGAGSGDEGESCSSSSSVSEGHGHHGGRRRRRHRRRHSHRRHRRHGGRSRTRSRGRSGGGGRSRQSPPRGSGTGTRGLYGCGDHRRDIEDFCLKNQLEPRVSSALKSMPESKQRKVMGTDGGENSYLLIDRVKNPNAVVMSRIRKIEAEP